jgi:hypothetical protein
MFSFFVLFSFLVCNVLTALATGSNQSGVNLATLLRQRDTTPAVKSGQTLQKRATQSGPGTWNGCLWNVAGVANFTS